MKNVILIIGSIIIISYSCSSQNYVIQGIVHALDSIPLIGAEVQVKSTGQTYYTGLTGKFVVECNSNDKFVIKASGFLKQKVKVTDKIKFVAVNLKPKRGSRQNNYSIGYGNISEGDRSSAVSSLNHKDINFSNYKNIVAIIRDNFAGVQVINNEIIIRGAASLQSSNAALLLIDGVIVETDFLFSMSPLDVKSIDIIKDATTAVYGSRGANGVVLIETLKGK